MESLLSPSPDPQPVTSIDTMFADFCGETFSSGNGDEIAVEPLESSSDGRDENCKHCQ